MEKQLTACEFLNSPSKSWCKQYPSERVNQPVMTASRACPAPPQVEPSNHESLTFGHRMPCTATPSEQMRQRSQPSRKRTRWRSTGHWHPPPANMLSKVGKSWEIHIKFCGHEFKVAGNPFSKPVAFPWKKNPWTLEDCIFFFFKRIHIYLSVPILSHPFHTTPSDPSLFSPLYLYTPEVAWFWNQIHFSCLN